MVAVVAVVVGSAATARAGSPAEDAPAAEHTELLDEYGPIRVGAASPTFAGWDLKGRVVSLDQQLPPHSEATRVLVIHFFATWCGPCREGLPVFAALARETEGVDVLLVAAGEDADKVAPYLEGLGISLPTVTDPFLTISGKFGLGSGSTSLPHTFVLDRQGIVRSILGAEGGDLADVLQQQAALALGGE